jgi:hypothetical protein
MSTVEVEIRTVGQHRGPSFALDKYRPVRGTRPRMIDPAFAARFAREWIDAWNSHDLERILSHYADDFEMSSPLIVRIAGEPSGTLRTKDTVGWYWARALRATPDLHFELITTLVGVSSITIYYRGTRGPAAEVFHFGPDLAVTSAFAHYAIPE